MQYVSTEGTQGLCPSGWHIPSKPEWQTLVAEVGNSSNALKAIGQGNGDGAGTNLSNFSALLTGYRNYSNGTFTNKGYSTLYWTSTGNGTGSTIQTSYYTDVIKFINFNTTYGFSIRCIKIKFLKYKNHFRTDLNYKTLNKKC